MFYRVLNMVLNIKTKEGVEQVFRLFSIKTVDENLLINRNKEKMIEKRFVNVNVNIQILLSLEKNKNSSSKVKVKLFETLGHLGQCVTLYGTPYSRLLKSFTGGRVLVEDRNGDLTSRGTYGPLIRREQGYLGALWYFSFV